MAEKKPNDQFRDTRERTKSPDHPDECLSRQELADLANAWIWEHHHEQYDINKGYVGKVEQGVIRWPNALRRRAFRAILHVSKDSELGFVNARARSRRAVVKLDDVKRRKLFETTTVGVGALALGRLRAVLRGEIAHIPIPARVGASDIEQIRSATQMFGSWSHTYGGGVAREAVMGELSWSVGLLEASCPERLRPELFSAVGDLAKTAGYMALDADVDEEARQLYDFALGCAEQAEDWRLRAYVLASMAEQAMFTGQPDEGLTRAEEALVRADRLTASGQALLHTTRALALTKMRRVQDTLTALGAAEERLAHSTPANDPFFYGAARHNHLTGYALADLAILGRDPGKATDRLEAAAAGYTKDYARSRAICLTKLAILTMATGDPLHAAAIGHEALDITGRIRSRFAAEELRELSRYATTHQDLEEVEHLRHRVAALMCTGNPSRNPPSTIA